MLTPAYGAGVSAGLLFRPVLRKSQPALFAGEHNTFVNFFTVLELIRLSMGIDTISLLIAQKIHLLRLIYALISSVYISSSHAFSMALSSIFKSWTNVSFGFLSNIARLPPSSQATAAHFTEPKRPIEISPLPSTKHSIFPNLILCYLF